MKKFVNRKKELNTLKAQYEMNESSLVIIYGRRRVGKTSLITRFLEDYKNTLYFLSTEESEQQNLNYFKNQVAEFTQNDLLKNSNVDWETVFKLLVNYKTESKKIIVIDEFQYLGQSNSAFPSIMQKIWDTLLKDANVMVILCGSLVSLMKAQTLNYSSPLYGRRTAQIKLKQIEYKHYKEFFEDDTKDLLPFYAVTGGVPKYIETFQKYGDIFDAILNSVLNTQSFLYEEPYFLLQKEVSEIGSYFSLIKAIAMGNRKLSDIAGVLGIKQTNLTKYLKVLMDLDLVEREVPITEPSPEKSKSGLYRITDNYIAFWFKFVYPYRSYLEKGENEYVISKIKDGFIQNYLSFIYEDVCREYIWELSLKNTWKYHFNKVGRYWGQKVGEIDIVAIDTEGKNILLGECKYSSSPKGINILHDLEEKTNAIKEITNSTNASYIIFSKSGFTQGLIDAVKTRTDVILLSNNSEANSLID